MTNTLALWVVIGLLIGANFFISVIKPIKFNDAQMEIITNVLQNIWAWNGIFPVATFFDAIKLFFSVLVGFMLIKIVFSFLSGKPDVE